MPIKGARFRFKTLKSGKKIRIAFKNNKVVEVTKFKKGKKGKLVKAGKPKTIASEETTV